MFNNIYQNKKVLVTGHTGFKGSWLCLWLSKLDSSVLGYSQPPPTNPNHFDLMNFKFPTILKDVCDYQSLISAFEKFNPEIVFHFAAQPSVLVSYEDPKTTVNTNVMGTLNVLEACRKVKSVKAVVVVTTDKCYENKEWIHPYRENDQLGGHDLYSASKACVEIITSSYRRSFCSKNKNLLIASVSAGNVIGGGDWTDDRLVPDIFRSVIASENMLLRNPDSTRPWQHVLEPLSGYLLLGQKLIEGNDDFASEWNFGPNLESNLKTFEVVKLMKSQWGSISFKVLKNKNSPHEASLLMLDSTKARMLLNWDPVWGIKTTIEKTVEWYKSYIVSDLSISHSQLKDFIKSARNKKKNWAE